MSAVLVVEDEQHLADGLRFNLEAEGYTVDAVSDGETALALFFDKRQTYDALVLDVMLPGKDGFTVAAELRALVPLDLAGLRIERLGVNENRLTVVVPTGALARRIQRIAGMTTGYVARLLWTKDTVHRRIGSQNMCEQITCPRKSKD